MSEPTEHDPSPATEESLDPAREAAVRRALAEAAGPEPVPAEVAARLDATLGDLVAERASGAAAEPAGVVPVSHPENPGVVVPLDAAARRRRMRARAVLGAAAAVVAVAVGVGIVNDQGNGSDGDAGSAAAGEALDEAERSDADRNGALEESPARGDDPADTAAEADDGKAEPETASGDFGAAPRRVVTDEPLREVRVEQLREDLVALQHLTLPHPATASYQGATLTAPADFMCEPASFGSGYLVGVTYDGKPAVVAFRQPMGSTQEAEVLACGTGDVLHSTTLPATG